MTGQRNDLAMMTEQAYDDRSGGRWQSRTMMTDQGDDDESGVG